MSEVDIYNMALLRIGHKQTMASTEDAGDAGRACRAFYGVTRDAVLAAFDWSFATKRATLGLLDETAPEGWAYAFSMPSDCVKPREIFTGMRQVGNDAKIPFESNGNKLYCDMETPTLIYTYRVENTGLFSPAFTSALAWALASELALCLPVKPDLANLARQAYKTVMSEAGATDVLSSFDHKPTCDFLRERE